MGREAATDRGRTAADRVDGRKHLFDTDSTIGPAGVRNRLFLEAVALVLILAIGAVLRFAALPQRGLIYWDEGKFALEGIRFLAFGRNLLGVHDPVTLGKAVGTAKPGHALLIALMYAIVGVHDYAPLYLNSVCSLTGVLLTYLIGRRLFGGGVALAGALFLATAEYDIVYARSALSEDDASVLLLLAVWLWLGTVRERGGLRSVIAAGLVAGAAFTVNYRMLIYIVVLVGVDAVLQVTNQGRATERGRARQEPAPTERWRRREPGGTNTWREPGGTNTWRWPRGISVGQIRALALRALVWAVTLAAAPLTWEAIDLIARSRGVILFRNEIAHAPTYYLLQAVYQIHEGKQSVVRFEPLPYLQWFFVRQGAVGLVLLLGGVALALWRRTLPPLIALSFVAVPYAVYITAPFVVPRNMNAAVPFAALLIGALLWSLVARILHPPVRVPVFIAAVLALCAFNAALAWRLTGVRSGLAEAAAYVEREDGGKAVVSNEIMVFYLRGGADRCYAPRMPYSETQLRSDIQFGYRYAVLDQYSGSTMDWLVRHHTSPVAQWPTEGNVSLGESLIDSEDTLTPDVVRASKVTRVYDLTRLHLPPMAHPRYPGCDREAPP